MTRRARPPRCARPGSRPCSRSGSSTEDEEPMPPSAAKPGDVVDGFRLEQELPLATTSALWRVSRPDYDGPLLMKVPRLERGANPINIVGFEAEQMILPKLSGPRSSRA